MVYTRYDEKTGKQTKCYVVGELKLKKKKRKQKHALLVSWFFEKRSAPFGIASFASRVRIGENGNTEEKKTKPARFALCRTAPAFIFRNPRFAINPSITIARGAVGRARASVSVRSVAACLADLPLVFCCLTRSALLSGGSKSTHSFILHLVVCPVSIASFVSARKCRRDQTCNCFGWTGAMNGSSHIRRKSPLR